MQVELGVAGGAPGVKSIMQTNTPIVVEVTNSGAPWWAIPLVGGVFALVGVFIAQAITLRLEKRRREREDARRLDAVLRDAARKYLDAAQSYATFVTSLTVGEVLIDTNAGPTRPESTFRYYSDERHKMDDAVAELALIAPKSMLVLAGPAQSFMHEFNLRVQNIPMTEKLKYEHADEIYNLIGPFANHVRAHFGLEPVYAVESNLAKAARDASSTSPDL